MKSGIHISKLSGKLAEFRAISVNTLTNDFCGKMHKSKKKDHICPKCYSFALLTGFRKNVAPALERNSKLLSGHLMEWDEIPFINDAYFRFDAHGELINLTHLVNYVTIARKNKGCTFALWTKRKDLINKYHEIWGDIMPDNLILIYSNPRISNIMDKPPKYFHRTFNNVLEHEEVERQNCTGQQCKDCLLCYTPNNGVTTIVEKVKKY